MKVRQVKKTRRAAAGLFSSRPPLPIRRYSSQMREFLKTWRIRARTASQFLLQELDSLRHFLVRRAWHAAARSAYFVLRTAPERARRRLSGPFARELHAPLDPDQLARVLPDAPDQLRLRWPPALASLAITPDFPRGSRVELRAGLARKLERAGAWLFGASLLASLRDAGDRFLFFAWRAEFRAERGSPPEPLSDVDLTAPERMRALYPAFHQESTYAPGLGRRLLERPPFNRPPLWQRAAPAITRRERPAFRLRRALAVTFFAPTEAVRALLPPPLALRDRPARMGPGGQLTPLFLTAAIDAGEIDPGEFARPEVRPARYEHGRERELWLELFAPATLAADGLRASGWTPLFSPRPAYDDRSHPWASVAAQYRILSRGLALSIYGAGEELLGEGVFAPRRGLTRGDAAPAPFRPHGAVLLVDPETMTVRVFQEERLAPLNRIYLFQSQRALAPDRPDLANFVSRVTGLSVRSPTDAAFVSYVDVRMTCARTLRLADCQYRIPRAAPLP